MRTFVGLEKVVSYGVLVGWVMDGTYLCTELCRCNSTNTVL